MNKLIEEAEKLYKQIDKIQLDLIKSRLDESEGQKAKATDEMEIVMCDVQQLLKCIIERKDNIVDLSEMWNISKKIPKRCKYFIRKNEDGSYDIYIFNDLFLQSEYERISAVKRLPYVDDLLPKGCE